MEVTMGWGRWDCTRCGRRSISGRKRRCPGCGDPRQQHELDAMRPPDPSDFESMSDMTDDEVDQATAGADWSCGRCGSTNRHDALKCWSCRASRDGAASMGLVGAVGAERRADLPRPTAPPRPRSEPTPPPEPKPEPKPVMSAAERAQVWKRRGRRGLIALGIVAAPVGYLEWASGSHDVEAVVTRLEWRHFSHRVRWESVDRADWGPVEASPGVAPVDGLGGIPGASNVRCEPRNTGERTFECGTESYEESEPYECGTREECHTVNNGNGSFTRSCAEVRKDCVRTVTRTRPRMCTEPVIREWCTWTSEAWSSAVETAVLAGEGHRGMTFPPMATGPLERVEHDGAYSVTVQWDGDRSFTRQVERAEYHTWGIGDPAVLEVSNRGVPYGFRKPVR